MRPIGAGLYPHHDSIVSDLACAYTRLGVIDRQYSTWTEVDLGAIANNVRRLREVSGVRLMAIVKANAYGHGLTQVAHTAIEAGASCCGVARLEEALDLRAAGIQAPILVLGHWPSERLVEAIGQGISLAVFSPEQVPVLRDVVRAQGKTARIHVKVDTGMSRLGASLDQTMDLLRTLREEPSVVVEGLFTHFARADEPDRATTAAQEREFGRLLVEIETAGLRPPLVHAANSAAAITRPSARFDMVRIGIALYGVDPSVHVRLPDGCRPALTWRARLSAVRALPPGRGISYGHDYVTQKEEFIGVVPVGYGDGFRRVEGNQVLIRGCKVPVVGRVCMDQFMVNLDAVPEACPEDEVVLLGRQGQTSISAEDVANRWETIGYEVTSCISSRVPRVFFG